LTKSRRRTCKSSGGSRRLVGQAVEDGVDRCQGAGDVYGVRYSRAGLVVWAAKPSVDGFRVWASQPGRRFQGGIERHVAESQRLRRGEANLSRKRGRLIDREKVVPEYPWGYLVLSKYLGALVELCNRSINKKALPPLCLITPVVHFQFISVRISLSLDCCSDPQMFRRTSSVYS